MSSLKHNVKKINFINRLKNAEQKNFCVCMEIYQIYEGNDYAQIYGVLSTLKNKKLKINKTLIEIYKDMLKNPDFAQDYWTGISLGIYKIGLNSIRLMKWKCYCDRSYYANRNYYDLMGSICKHLNEKP